MNDAQHICFFMPVIQMGGVERTLLNIVTELSTRNYKISILTSAVSPSFQAKLPETVRIVHLASASRTPLYFRPFSQKTRASLGALTALVKFLKSERPHAMYSFQGSTVAVLARMLARSKCFLFVRESNTPSQSFIHDGMLGRKLKMLMKRVLYSRADKVIAVSQGVADDLVESVKLKESIVTTIYNPTFTPELVESANHEVDHPWLTSTNSTPVIASVGRLSRQKDFLTLVDAFSIVSKNRKAKLLIVGEGPERKNIQARIDKLGLSSDADLVGEHTNPYKYLIKSSIFVLSSIFEGLPNVVIEAQGCGLPVVATDCPSGPREILLDGRAGTLVPVSDPESMASAILAYIDDEKLRNAHIEIANDNLNRFTPARSVDSYLALIPGPGS